MGPQEASEFNLVQYFKLYLKDTSDKHRDSPDVLDMITHYLKYMHGIIQDHLKRTVHRPATVKYCITIPAGWAPHHKNIMRQAAVQAGFIPHHNSDRLLLLSEPEAAAFTATKTKQMTLRPHENFMIVDAGGGTIDVTTYEVVPGERRDALMLKEIAPPDMLLMVSWGI
jgi:molecular chaperone DnaK (HSP70)